MFIYCEFYCCWRDKRYSFFILNEHWISFLDIDIHNRNGFPVNIKPWQFELYAIVCIVKFSRREQIWSRLTDESVLPTYIFYLIYNAFPTYLFPVSDKWFNVTKTKQKQRQTGIKVKQFPKLFHCSIPHSTCCLSVLGCRGIALGPAHVEYIKDKNKIQISMRYYLNW